MADPDPRVGHGARSPRHRTEHPAARIRDPLRRRRPGAGARARARVERRRPDRARTASAGTSGIIGEAAPRVDQQPLDKLPMGHLSRARQRRSR